jgi:undecaprenyl-diphosphatase
MMTLVAASPVVADTTLTIGRAAVLGTVQGLTEFLPVSSSAHLFIVPKLLGWGYHGVAFDVALHGGTLLALLFAFAGDWWRLATGLVTPNAERRGAAWRLLAWLAVATVPGAIAGKLLEDAAEYALRSLPLQAVMLIVFGFLLWAVDRWRGEGRETMAPGWGTALLMGFAQALALVPGVSRSGVTITAGRAAGLARVSAARFSFLLATPITLGAVLLKVRHMPHDVSRAALAVGVVTSALVGLLAIRGLLRWLQRAGFGVFFAYRAALGLALLAVAFRGR